MLQVLQRLREEQQQLLARHGAGITTAVIQDMVYADAVIR
jgi:hypothetical protein